MEITAIDLNKKDVEIITKLIELTQKNKLKWEHPRSREYTTDYYGDGPKHYHLNIKLGKSHSGSNYLTMLQLGVGVNHTTYNTLLEDLLSEVKYQVDRDITRKMVEMIDTFLENSI